MICRKSQSLPEERSFVVHSMEFWGCKYAEVEHAPKKIENKVKQNCSYQGEALNVPTAS